MCEVGTKLWLQPVAGHASSAQHQQTIFHMGFSPLMAEADGHDSTSNSSILISYSAVHNIWYQIQPYLLMSQQTQPFLEGCTFSNRVLLQ